MEILKQIGSLSPRKSIRENSERNILNNFQKSETGANVKKGN